MNTCIFIWIIGAVLTLFVFIGFDSEEKYESVFLYLFVLIVCLVAWPAVIGCIFGVAYYNILKK